MRTIQNLDQRGHRRVVQKPTLISLIAQIAQSDSVITPTSPSRLFVFAVEVFGQSARTWGATR
jgi:hypothetical protein